MFPKLAKEIKRVVVIGPESTGKSTLSQGLARHFSTVFVEEYARSYLDRLGRPYVQKDLLRIAQGQIELEDQRARAASHGLLFCDTNLEVIKVWSEHSFGHCEPEILQLLAERRYDYYLLTHIDLPWQHDPQREHPEPAMRSYFFNIYSDIVQQSGLPFAKIEGDGEERLQMAIHALGQWGFLAARGL